MKWIKVQNQLLNIDLIAKVVLPTGDNVMVTVYSHNGSYLKLTQEEAEPLLHAISGEIGDGRASNLNNQERHTPGPWSIHNTDWRGKPTGGKLYISGNPQEAFDEDDDEDEDDGTVVVTSVCIVEGNRTSKQTTLANARLIAASPGYFAGVEKMLANEQCGGDGWWEGWEMLKAAHAKAKEGA